MSEKRYSGLKQNWKCLLACTLVSMSPFQYGIDFGIIGGLQAMRGFLQIFGHEDPNTPIGYNISSGRQQLISSLMILGAFISSGLAGPIATVLSRRATLWTACVLCIVSNVIMMTTTKIGGLYAGRLIIGLANGLFMTFAQLYLQECSPSRYRGLAISTFQWWTSIGIGTLVGTIIDNFTAPIHGKRAYILPLGIVYVVPGLMAIGMIFIPESPRWLLQQGKHDQARKALQWLRQNSDSVDLELTEMENAILAEKELASGAAIVDLWRNAVDRRRTLLSIASVSIQAASGAMYMISYGTYYFEMAKVGSPFENSCILVSVGVAAIIINSCVISKIGRRRVFLITGVILCGIAQIILAAVYTAQPGTARTGKVVVGVSVLYIAGYNGMISTYAWLCGGEIPSQRLRSYTFGLAAAAGFLGAWLATFTAPYFINPDSLNWGPRYGYIWAPSCWVTAVWIYFFLPETQNRTLEEIDEMFEARLPARKFRKHKCVGKVISDDKLGRKSTEEMVWSSEKATAEATINIA
ncbi:MFS transporter [Glonium stellatum]|uniref:MFS transporter n=1 Tax=Glonium stellatum TaxID=574774 RepID=A0A8E2JZR3_9PEZI|nr:MFS transporter [Glonium stellatum]